MTCYQTGNCIVFTQGCIWHRGENGIYNRDEELLNPDVDEMTQLAGKLLNNVKTQVPGEEFDGVRVAQVFATKTAKQLVERNQHKIPKEKSMRDRQDHALPKCDLQLFQTNNLDASLNELNILKLKVHLIAFGSSNRGE